MNRWQRFKMWSSVKWSRFKHWLFGLLVSLGVVSVALVQTVNVTYTRATQYDDGSPLPLSEIAETRLYCNDVLIATEPGADGVFGGVDALLPAGDSVCYGTHVATNALESAPSVSITISVLTSSAPKPPELIP